MLMSVCSRCKNTIWTLRSGHSSAAHHLGTSFKSQPHFARPRTSQAAQNDTITKVKAKTSPPSDAQSSSQLVPRTLKHWRRLQLERDRQAAVPQGQPYQDALNPRRNLQPFHSSRKSFYATLNGIVEFLNREKRAGQSSAVAVNSDC